MAKTEAGWITETGWRLTWETDFGIIASVSHVCRKNDTPVLCEHIFGQSYYRCPSCRAKLNYDEIVPEHIGYSKQSLIARRGSFFLGE